VQAKAVPKNWDGVVGCPTGTEELGRNLCPGICFDATSAFKMTYGEIRPFLDLLKSRTLRFRWDAGGFGFK
jgi:hypothetical protein